MDHRINSNRPAPEFQTNKELTFARCSCNDADDRSVIIFRSHGCFFATPLAPPNATSTAFYFEKVGNRISTIVVSRDHIYACVCVGNSLVGLSGLHRSVP